MLPAAVYPMCFADMGKRVSSRREGGRKRNKRESASGDLSIDGRPDGNLSESCSARPASTKDVINQILGGNESRRDGNIGLFLEARRLGSRISRAALLNTLY